MRHLVAAVLAVTPVIAACDGTSEPDFSSYTLTGINGEPLPFPLLVNGYQSTGLEIIAGGFEFHGRGDVAEWHQLRCLDQQPPGTVCEEDGDGVVETDYIFNALEDRLYHGDSGWFPMRIWPDSALIQFGPNYEIHYRYIRDR